jgi:hypothetical protein
MNATINMIETFESKATVNAMVDALIKCNITVKWTPDNKCATVRVKNRKTGEVIFPFSAYKVGRTTWKVIRAAELFL